jgi:hypothetical protein
MRMGNLRAAGLAISLALAALVLGACGSGGGGTTVVKPPITPDTGAELAKLSDRVASDLDAGDTCHAAHAADELSSAVDDANLPASMQSGVQDAAGRLVDEVNCPPPPPPPEPEKKKDEKPKDEKHDEHGDENDFVPPGHSKHGGFVPPGHEKLKGE